MIYENFLYWHPITQLPVVIYYSWKNQKNNWITNIITDSKNGRDEDGYRRGNVDRRRGCEIGAWTSLMAVSTSYSYLVCRDLFVSDEMKKQVDRAMRKLYFRTRAFNKDGSLDKKRPFTYLLDTGAVKRNINYLFVSVMRKLYYWSKAFTTGIKVNWQAATRRTQVGRGKKRPFKYVLDTSTHRWNLAGTRTNNHLF